MSVIHNKDLGTKQKALAINLDPQIYGSFAEIGAGQDVAANFFKAGASSGTIAKTMSAYDMTFSDAIYGAQQGRRYVSEARLIAMLEKEYGLLIERLAPLGLSLFGILGIFLLAAWLGLFRQIPAWLHLIILVVTGSALLVALWHHLRHFQWPSRADAIRRVERDSDLHHRPLTHLTDRAAGIEQLLHAL